MSVASVALPTADDAMADTGPELVAAVESRLREIEALAEPAVAASAMLGAAETVLASWVSARGEAPTLATREGFRLLALHRQGAQDEPSFNACRETCREIAYHYNLLCLREGDGLPEVDPTKVRRMMGLLVNHLALFVGAKMHAAQVGEFCCAARPLRERD